MVPLHVHAQIQALVEATEQDAAHVVGAAEIVLANRHDYISGGFLDSYLSLLHTVENSAGCHVFLNGHVPDEQYYVSHLLVLLTLIELKAMDADNANYLTQNDRLAALEGLHVKLDDAANVLGQFDDFLNGHAGNNQLFQSLTLLFLYLRHAIEASLAMAHGLSPVQLLQDLHALASNYDTLADPTTHGIALAGVVETLLAYFQRSDDETRAENTPWLRQMTDELATLMEANHHPDTQRFLELAKILVQALGFLDLRKDAKKWHDRSVKVLRATLAALEDDADRSFYLRDSDDWLGLAIQVEGLSNDRAGPLFRDAWDAKYPGLLPDIPHEELATIRAHLSRHGTLLQYRIGPMQRVQQVANSHNIFLALNGLYLAASEDLREFGATGAVSADQRWRVSLENLSAQLRLKDLSGTGLSAWDPPRLLVEANGSGLHLPWTGLVIDAGCRSPSILVRNLQDSHRNRRGLPEGESNVLILNCFSPREPLDGRLKYLRTEILASSIACDSIVCATREDFVDRLSTKAYKLIVIGCHGAQARVTEPLSINIGGTMVPAVELWKQVQFQVASTVVLLNCYGGGGLSLATGEFGSQVEMALDAGARAVIASRWPAWMNNRTSSWFNAFVVRLAKMNAPADIWEIGRRGIDFVDKLKMFSIRDWATWSVYTSGCWLEPPLAGE